jgi:hypothetical protein
MDKPTQPATPELDKANKVHVRSRGELLRLTLLLEALATATKAELRKRLIDVHEQEGVFETVKTHYGEVYAAQTQPRGVVKDQERLADFLEQHTGLTIRREVREISSSGLESFLSEHLTPVVHVTNEQIAELPGETYVFSPDDSGGFIEATDAQLAEVDREFEVVDRQGRLVPGVVWFTGGTVHNVTVKGAVSAVSRARRVAKQYATGEIDWADLPW